MKIKKIIVAQAAKQLIKKRLAGKFGEYEAYLVTGPTIPIKESLKALGFSWDGREIAWRLSANKMNEGVKQRLSELGVVDNSNGMGTNVVSPVVSPVAPSMTNPIPPKVEEKTKTWVTEDEDLTKWYGFPINSGILKFDVDTETDGAKYTVHVTVDRNVTWGGDTYTKRKSRDEKGLPRYLIHMEIPELGVKEDSARKSKIKWGEYSEEELLNRIKDDYTNAILKKESRVTNTIPINKLLYGMETENDLKKRTPEYLEFLNKLVDSWNEIPEDYPKYIIKIEDGDYKGEYEAVPTVIGAKDKLFKLSLSTNIERANAPRRGILGEYDGVSLYHTYTIQDFHNRIREYIASKLEKIKSNYIDYLKTFPYLEDQMANGTEIANKVKGYVLSGGGTGWEEVLRVLQERGLIRPHKRQRQNLGLTMGDEIRWVLDDNKIRDGIYGRGYGVNSPGYFYDLVAYYVLNEIRNSNVYFMYVDSVRTVTNLLNEMGNNFRAEEIRATVKGIGDKIIFKIRGATESKEEKKKVVNPNTNSDLAEFFNFAKGVGVPEDDLDAENAKSVYRVLARKLHPDLEMDVSKKPEAEENFKKLQGIWDRVPNIYKNAYSWYGIYRMG